MDCCHNEKHLRIKEKFNNSIEYIETVEEVSRIFSLLGDFNRVKILLALMEGELCVQHLCEVTGAKQSVTSQHLAKLKANKIVKCRKESNQVLYTIADDHIYEIIRTALKHKNCKI